MRIKNKLIIAMASLLPALAVSTASAGDFNSESMSANNSMSSASTGSMSNHDGLAVGIFYDQSVSGMVPKVTFMKDWFVASAGLSYTRENPSVGESYNEYYVPISLGYLREIAPNISYSMGPSLVWTKTTQTGADNGYVFGPQANLYYFATDHIMFTASIMPIARQKETNGDRNNTLFQEGALGLSYTFG